MQVRQMATNVKTVLLMEKSQNITGQHAIAWFGVFAH